MEREPIDLYKVGPREWVTEEEATSRGFGLMAKREFSRGREPFFTDLPGVIILLVVFYLICHWANVYYGYA